METFHEPLKKIILSLNSRFSSFPLPNSDQQERSVDFYYSIVFRTLLALDSIYILLTQFIDRPFLRYPYVLIMRTIVMDIIIAELAAQKEKEGQDQIKSFLDSVYNEHINASFNTLSTAEQFYPNDHKFKEIAKAIRDKVSSANPNLKQKNRLNTISPLISLKQVYTHSKELHKNNLTKLFEHYDLFSKLVHFGENSINLMYLQVSDPNSKLGDKTLQDNLVLVLLFTIDLMNTLGIEINENDSIWNLVDEITYSES